MQTAFCSGDYVCGFGANTVFCFEKSGISKRKTLFASKIPIRYFQPEYNQMGQIQKFWPGESISLQNFTPVVCKVSLQEFLPVLAALRTNIPIWYIRPGCDQMGQIWKFWPGENISLQNFTPVVCIVSLQEFLPVLTALRPKIPIWYIRPGCDQIVLLTRMRLFPYYGTFDQP